MNLLIAFYSFLRLNSDLRRILKSAVRKTRLLSLIIVLPLGRRKVHLQAQQR